VITAERKREVSVNWDDEISVEFQAGMMAKPPGVTHAG
jgi:hypothetical protein